VLYPAPLEVTHSPPFPGDPFEIAAENYSLLNDGLSVTVDVELEFGSILPNIILGGYIFLSLAFLYGMYRVGNRKIALEEAALNKEFQHLQEKGQELSKRLADLKEDRDIVYEERDRLEKSLMDEKRKAGSNEAELFEEIVQIDETLEKNLLLQQQQEKEIKTLKEKINIYEDEYKRAHAPKGKEIEVLSKRFGTLYKNISVHERAVEGFAALTENMKIKGEEIIHRLNEAPEQVPIKRKVFRGKGKMAVWEVLFSYNGRLYFRRTREQQIEVLAVGNKNTQSKDLEFINKIVRIS